MTAAEHIAKARAAKIEDRAVRHAQAIFAGEAAIAEGTAEKCPFDPVAESDLHEFWTWYVDMRRRGGRPVSVPKSEPIKTESAAYNDLIGGGT